MVQGSRCVQPFNREQSKIESMFRVTLALRVLLSFSLILNGSAYAVASTHMQLGHGDMSALSTSQPAGDHAAMADPPCHENNAASGSTEQASEAVPSTAAGSLTHASTDCCENETCSCPCMHPAQATIPVVALRSAVIEHAGVLRPLARGHAAPVLAHPIRPPIG